MTELFSTVLNMSLTASVVIGVVLLLRFMLKNAPKVYSYALWSVVLFRLLCPVSPELGLSILPGDLGYHPGEQTMEIFESMEPGETAMAAYHAVGDALNGGLGTVKVQIRPEYEEQMTESGDTARLFQSEGWFLVFSRLWPTGTALMAGYSLWSLLCLRRRLKTAVLLRDNVYRAQGIETPFVMGLVRPKIYLPAGILDTEMPYIIRHEQYHIRRGDHIIKVLAFGALCLHWFNPLVWLAFVLAGKDMEMSCDEAVLREMGGEIRCDYSQSLLSLATGRRRIAATPLAFGEGDPKGRIKNVLKWKKPSVKVTVIAALVCVIAAVLCISDPAKPVDTEQVTGVKHLISREADESAVIAPFEFEEAWVYEEIPVSEGGMDSLLALVESHATTRRMSLPDWEPRGDEGGARLELADGSYYELRSWYVNGFSFHPAHYGEDEYDTTLARYDAEGNLTACWTMEYDFDRPFRDWMVDRCREEKEQASASNRRSISFVDLPAGQTYYLNEDIILTADKSSVDYQITYTPTRLALQVGLRGEDGTEYIHYVEDGSRVGMYRGLAAGRYTPFVRNVDEGYRTEPNATGVVNFDLTSQEDYFQKSTPWPQEGITTEPVHLSAYEVLHEAIMDHHRSDKSDQYFCCESHVILANEEGTRAHPVTGNDLRTMHYYLVVLYQEYLFTEDGIVDEGGARIPTVITLEENADGSWSVLNYWEPRDGSYYVEDIRTVFPADCVDEALDNHGDYVIPMKQDCYAQAIEYAKIDSDVKMDVDAVISDLIDSVCADAENPAHPGIHPIEYWELLYYGDYTRDYCERHLAALEDTKSYPANVDLRARVMEMLLGELNL